MNYKRFLVYPSLRTCILAALFLGTVGSSLIPTYVAARGLGAPSGNSETGGVRGACSVADRTRGLRALVDASDPALTTEENPTLLFYSPFGKPTSGSPEANTSVATTAEFELRDEDENSALKSQKIVVSIPAQPGIVSLKIPSSEVRLEPNKEYFWVFRVICDRDDVSANPSVSGWIKRVDSGASETVWFDKLNQIVQSRTKDLESWTKLLGQFGFQDLNQAPIAELKPDANGELRATGE
ncbi:MAG TPA: DUF928 domain-containing protein [Coleofasciculaceae cyanobacterium]